MVKEMKVEDGRLVLLLDEAASAVDDGGPIVGFAVAGKDRKFHPATATHLVTGKDGRGREQKILTTLALSSSMVPHPIHYRYAWGRSPLGNLQAARHADIPFATQRSDDWPLENIPRGVLGAEAPETIDRGQRRKLMEALRQQDLQRRIHQAKQLILGTNPD